MNVRQTTFHVFLVTLGTMGPVAWADSPPRLREIEALLQQNKVLPDVDKVYLGQNPDKVAAYIRQRASQSEFAKRGRTAVAKMIPLLPKGQAREDLARQMLEAFSQSRVENSYDTTGAALELVQEEPKAVRAFLAGFGRQAKEARTMAARQKMLGAPEAVVDAVIAGIARANAVDFLPDLKALRDSTSEMTRPNIDYVISYLEGRFPPRQFRHDSPDALIADLVAFLKAHPDIPPEQLAEFHGWDRQPERVTQLKESKGRSTKRWDRFLEPYTRITAVPIDKWKKTDLDGSQAVISYEIPGGRLVEILLRQELSGEWVLYSVLWLAT